MISRRVFSAALVLALFVAGCGKKGPPLPPLVKLPTPPAEFVAERRGASVDLQFIVPSANTDNTRPANVGRVDVYAITTREPPTEAEIVKHGKRVATVAVKAPKDPNKTIEEDEAPSDMEAPEGEGLEQGAVARVSEELTREALVPVQPKTDAKATPAATTPEDGPLLPPANAPLARSYVVLGVSTRDRKGPASKRLTVPLVPPPPAPEAPTVTYDEKAITVKWSPVALGAGVQRAPIDDELPSTAIGVTAPVVTYNVYDATSKAKLTRSPIAAPPFSDARIAWGEKRCYTVRAVETIGEMKIESDARDPVCTTLTDTFAPAAPENVQSAPLEGAISLVWDPNTEKDLAGYIVFRGDSERTLQPILSAPIQETTFKDQVQPGIRFVYAVKAVDRAGNQSPLSKAVEEAARE